MSWIYIPLKYSCVLDFLCLESGTIIDSFGALRDEQDEQIKEMTSTVCCYLSVASSMVKLKELTTRVGVAQCFICSHKQEEIEQRGGVSFTHHIRESHNMWNYMFYVAFLGDLNPSDCNGLQAQVRALYARRDPAFLPAKRALCLENTNSQELDEKAHAEDFAHSIFRHLTTQARTLARLEARVDHSLAAVSKSALVREVSPGVEQVSTA